MAGGGGAGVALGLASALTWGAGDFGGGLASRRHGLFATLPLAQALSLGLLAAALIATREPAPGRADVYWAAGSGLAGAAGLALYYRALAIGRMGLAAPVGAVVAAMVPVLAGALLEGLPGGLTLVGFALAITGVWFVARNPAAGNPGAGIWLAAASGLGFGAFFVLLGQVESGLLWPVTIARGVALVALTGFGWSVGRLRAPPLAALPLIAAAGVFDGAGNLFYLLAAQAGRLDVAAVLASLYPVSTIILARVVLREALVRRQWLGVFLAVLALPLIGSGS